MKTRIIAATALCLGHQLQSLFAAEINWTSELISPVANPILFESPAIGVPQQDGIYACRFAGNPVCKF